MFENIKYAHHNFSETTVTSFGNLFFLRYKVESKTINKKTSSNKLKTSAYTLSLAQTKVQNTIQNSCSKSSLRVVFVF